MFFVFVFLSKREKEKENHRFYYEIEECFICRAAEDTDSVVGMHKMIKFREQRTPHLIIVIEIRNENEEQRIKYVVS